MKSVLISIQPKWCELIANGKKTVEVRKTRPKLETPFKVYIYCTKGKHGTLIIRSGNEFLGYKEQDISGKVIGEFICDEIDRLAHCGTRNNDIRLRIEKNLYYKELDYSYLNKCQLTYADIDEYSKGGDVYAWHISNLVIYDKPRELNEFYNSCYSGCDSCEYQSWDYGYGGGKDLICAVRNQKPIKRPPQSWCYVKSEVITNEQI